jgi:hypothetical protein
MILHIIGLGVLIAVVNERKIVFCSEQCGGEAHEDVGKPRRKESFFRRKWKGIQT